MPNKTTIVSTLLFVLIALLVFISSASGHEEFAPNSLLIPVSEATQPSPTATVTYPLTGGMQMGSMAGMSGMGTMGGAGNMTGMTTGTCPMMGSGAMAGTMSGDAMSTGSMTMPGMTGMGSMSMQGTMGMPNLTTDQMNDLMGFSVYQMNPWWLVGWILVLAILIGVIAAAVVGIYWLFRNFKRSQPVSTGS